MKLIPNWRGVLRRAWSVRLMLLGGALAVLEAALPLMKEFGAPQGLFAALSGLAAALACAARLLSQRNLS